MTTENTIFKLIELEYCGENPQNHEFEVSRTSIGFYSSLTDAGQAIIESVKRYDYARQNPLFGFLIEEYALDAPCYWWTESRRIFLPDGTFLNETFLNENKVLLEKHFDFKEFPDNAADKVYFVSGDLMLLRNRDTVTPDIVTHVPTTPEETPKPEGTRGISFGSRFNGVLPEKCRKAYFMEMYSYYHGRHIVEF